VILPIAAGVFIEGAAAIWALKWALPKSDAAFYSVFAGDALLRLVALGGVVWWVLSRHEPIVAPLLTLGFGYLTMSLLQIPFLYKAR
jgi:hypothetical protein